MSGTRIVGSWSARDGSVAVGEAEIRRFRSRRPGGAVRQARHSLVVLAGRDRAAGMAALETARTIGARAPGRTIVAVTAPAAASGTDAAVTVRSVERPDGSTTCLEDVVLVARGAAAGHLASVLRPWLLPGLPVVVWMPADLPRSGEPVTAAADRVVVDTRRVPGVSPLADVLTAGRGLPLCDLAWARTHAWRTVLAGLFAGTDFSPYTRRVERVEAAGPRPATSLLAGWLISTLDVAADVVRLSDADRTAVRIGAGPGSRSATFAVDQTGQDRDGCTVSLSASIAGGTSHRRTVRLASQTVGADLERALSAPLARDAVWWDALSAAAALG